MEERTIQSKELVPNVPHAFERLRREKKEQSAADRILSWLHELTPDPLVALPRSRLPLKDIHNYNSSISESSPHPAATSLKRKLSSFVPPHQKVKHPTSPCRLISPPVMDVFEDAVSSAEPPTTPSPRKRGRPRKAVVVNEQNPASLMHEDDGQSLVSLPSLATDSFVLPSMSQGADRSYSPTKSPSKTSTTRTASTVTKREKLAYLTPPTRFMTLEEVKDDGGLPEMASRLWLQHVQPALSETRVIPIHLEQRLRKASDTPMKSKPLISTNFFGPVTHFDHLDHDLVWSTVSDALLMAKEYRNRGTESHWIGVVVNPLLQLLRRLKKFQKANDIPLLAVIDITVVEISPRSLCPFAEEPALFKDLNKRIDCAIGLRLPTVERKVLERGRYQAFSQPSINQTSTFVNMVPMFLNIEVKRSHSNHDPLIQLAIWVAAEFVKRTIENYSLDMPVLAIAVVEDRWDLYMVYADVKSVGQNRYGCNFVGPFEMGSTMSVEGVFKILGILCSLASWGLADYRLWFEREILGKYKPAP